MIKKNNKNNLHFEIPITANTWNRNELFTCELFIISNYYIILQENLRKFPINIIYYYI